MQWQRPWADARYVSCWRCAVTAGKHARVRVCMCVCVCVCVCVAKGPKKERSAPIEKTQSQCLTCHAAKPRPRWFPPPRGVDFDKACCVDVAGKCPPQCNVVRDWDGGPKRTTLAQHCKDLEEENDDNDGQRRRRNEEEL